MLVCFVVSPVPLFDSNHCRLDVDFFVCWLGSATPGGGRQEKMPIFSPLCVKVRLLKHVRASLLSATTPCWRRCREERAGNSKGDRVAAFFGADGRVDYFPTFPPSLVVVGGVTRSWWWPGEIWGAHDGKTISTTWKKSEPLPAFTDVILHVFGMQVCASSSP